MQPGNAIFPIKTLDYCQFCRKNIEKRGFFGNPTGIIWGILRFPNSPLGLKSPLARTRHQPGTSICCVPFWTRAPCSSRCQERSQAQASTRSHRIVPVQLGNHVPMESTRDSGLSIGNAPSIPPLRLRSTSTGFLENEMIPNHVPERID